VFALLTALFNGLASVLQRMAAMTAPAPRRCACRCSATWSIVAVICNGLEVLGLGAAAQNLWTAAVLLAAVTVDTVARRSPPNT
jgi:hypothetical protein